MECRQTAALAEVGINCKLRFLKGHGGHYKKGGQGDLLTILETYGLDPLMAGLNFDGRPYVSCVCQWRGLDGGPDDYFGHFRKKLVRRSNTYFKSG